MSRWNDAIISEFRANRGVVGGPFDGRPLLLLHTVGARSGVDRVTPLTFLDHGGRVYVFASAGGSDRHPAWYHNVVANPHVTYEVGSETRSAQAREVTGPERDAIYTQQARVWPIFAEYAAGTDRVIPVVELA